MVVMKNPRRKNVTHIFKHTRICQPSRFFLFTINCVGLCQSANRQCANHTVSEERGGDYWDMASSQMMLSEGEKRDEEGGF